MSLTIRSTMNNQAAVQGIDNADKNTDNSKQPRNRKTINASELNLKPYNDNQIDAKRLRARKQAMKLISDAWKSSDMRDKNIEDMKLDKLNKLDEITELKNKVSDLENEKEAYRADYGVDMDSQEQKDLELLEKYQNNRYGSAEDTFSKEELDRLKELQNTPLTEYQEKVLKLNSSQIHFKDQIGQKELKIACTTASIALAEIDRDKFEVLEYRLKNEYGVDIRLEPLPYEHIRWIENPEEIDVNRIVGTSDMKKIKDLKGNPLLVFANSWSVNMVLERNEGLKLSEFGRN